MAKSIILYATIMIFLFLPRSSVEGEELGSKICREVLPTLCKIEVEVISDICNNDDPDDIKIEHNIYSGSGVFIENKDDSSTVLILTASHLVAKEKEEITILVTTRVREINYKIIPYLNPSHYYSATMICNELDKDLAVLESKIPRHFYKTAKPGNSDELRWGDDLYVFGHPGQYDNTVTRGIVSGLHRRLGDYISDFIQSDSHVNPGNSGGPAFDSLGRLVGIIISCAFNKQGISFIAPINLMPKHPYDRKDPERLTPTMGCEALLENFPRSDNKSPKNIKKDLEALAKMMGLKKLSSKTEKKMLAILAASEQHGAIVDRLYKDNNVFDYGDIITEINGKEIKNGMQIRIILSEMKTGGKIIVKYKRVIRGRIREQIARVVLKKRP